MDFYGFNWSIFILWLCCFFYWGLHIVDAFFGVYLGIGYFVIELLLLIRQFYKSREE